MHPFRPHIDHLLVLIALVAAAAISAAAISAPPGEPGCTLYVLRSSDGEIAVDAVAVPEGRTVVLPAEEIITFILPLSLGQSGDLIQEGRPKGDVVARCEDGMLQVSVEFDDGRRRQLPPVDVASLPGYDMRVNVVRGDGLKRAFTIEAYGAVEEAGGPVVNMFGGAVPLQDGDFAITTEVSAHERPEWIEGRISLRIAEGFILAEGTIAGGAIGSFIIDFGAGGTVVDRALLPEDAQIRKVKAIEYSEGRGRELDGTMGGAGGSVSGFLGNAVLPDLRLGDVSFGDVTVGVVRDMPEFIAGQKVSGIIGLDLLRRAPVVTVEFMEDDTARLTFADRGRIVHGDASIAIPFKISVEHIFIAGSVHGAPIDFLLDTGARYSILSQGLAEMAGLALGDDVAHDFRGLDGAPIPARTTRVDGFVLGDHTMPGRRFYVASLPVLDSFGLTGSGALLGVDFLREYGAVVFDFGTNGITLHAGRMP